MAVANDDALAERARWMRNHGMNPRYYHKFVGGNFRMDELQAALLRVKLRRFADYTERRRQNAARYLVTLAEIPGVAVGDGSEETKQARLLLPHAARPEEHIWNQFTLRIPGAGRRDALKQALTAAEIGCEIYYPVTLDQQECFAGLPESSRSGCEVSHRLAAEVLSIPVFPELTTEQLDAVTGAVRDFLARE